jgi:hypothetical protein
MIDGFYPHFPSLPTGFSGFFSKKKIIGVKKKFPSTIRVGDRINLLNNQEN